MFRDIKVTLQNMKNEKMQADGQHMPGTGLGFIKVKEYNQSKTHYRVMLFSHTQSIGPDWPTLTQARGFVTGLTKLMDWTLFNPLITKPWETFISVGDEGGQIKLSEAIDQLRRDLER